MLSKPKQATGWRTDASYYKSDTDGGVLNVSPAWHAQAHEASLTLGCAYSAGWLTQCRVPRILFGQRRRFGVGMDQCGNGFVTAKRASSLSMLCLPQSIPSCIGGLLQSASNYWQTRKSRTCMNSSRPGQQFSPPSQSCITGKLLSIAIPNRHRSGTIYS